MKRSPTRYLLFSVALIVCASCASDYKLLQPSTGDPSCWKKLAPQYLQTSWYHASVDVVGFHVSGLLLVKNMPDSSYRVVFTNEAGVTFFDFGFSNIGDFTVHHVIRQMDKRPVIQTLRQDFALILGIPFRSQAYKTWSHGEEVYYGVSQKKETAYFITNKECASLHRLELGSARKQKVVVHVSGDGYPTPEKIDLSHKTFDMQIKLTRFHKE
jgi:hypothetical protein